MIMDLATHSRLPWIIGGDINEIFFNCKKLGGPPKSQTVIDSFQESFANCGLFYLGYSGYDYTWWNCRDDEKSVEERLDRFMANAD